MSSPSPSPPRLPIKSIVASFAILFALLIWNSNHTLYIIGLLAGTINIAPEDIPATAIRVTGTIVLFILFMIVSSSYIRSTRGNMADTQPDARPTEPAPVAQPSPTFPRPKGPLPYLIVAAIVINTSLIMVPIDFFLIFTASVTGRLGIDVIHTLPERDSVQVTARHFGNIALIVCCLVVFGLRAFQNEKK